MSEIEWQPTQHAGPQHGAILEFCHAHRLPAPQDGSAELLVFIEQGALEGLHAFLAHDLTREHGGVLVGLPCYDPQQGRYFLDIRGAIPAQETEGTPSHLQFTPETWGYISGIIDENYPNLIVVGWYHSHPGLGVFMSGTDRATQAAFYGQDWQVAVVCDPARRQTGWFAGADCEPLRPHQVIPYAERTTPSGASRPAASETAVLLEQEYLKRTELAGDWRWLLPFGLLILGLALVWAGIRGYRKTRGEG